MTAENTNEPRNALETDSERQEWVEPTLTDLQITETMGQPSGPGFNDGGPAFNDYIS